MNAIALETALAEDLPALNPGEGVLDTSTDLAMRAVVLLYPGRKFRLTTFTAVRDEQTRPPIAAIRNHCRFADSSLRTGQSPCPAVITVARHRLTDHDDVRNEHSFNLSNSTARPYR